MRTMEDIILQYSRRGMDLLRRELPQDFCRKAARAVWSWPRGTVLLATGFYVAGHAETDGPSGTLVLARALKQIGFRPVVVTDAFCRGFFEPEGIEVIYMDANAGERSARRILEKYRPVGMISVERCGENVRGDYANMRGVSIRSNTAPVDLLFDLARGTVPTVGIGDGGNEIGMGNVKKAISEKLSLVPCRTETDHLIIATVSNWGAYGLAAELSGLAYEDLLMSAGELRAFLTRTVAMGSVDGMSGRPVLRVDGFPVEMEESILEELRRASGFDGWDQDLRRPA